MRFLNFVCSFSIVICLTLALMVLVAPTPSLAQAPQGTAVVPNPKSPPSPWTGPNFPKVPGTIPDRNPIPEDCENAAPITVPVNITMGGISCTIYQRVNSCTREILAVDTASCDRIFCAAIGRPYGNNPCRAHN